MSFFITNCAWFSVPRKYLNIAMSSTDSGKTWSCKAGESSTDVETSLLPGACK